MKIILQSLIILFSVIFVKAQNCEEINQNKVLMVGDSWAFFMLVDGTFNRVFEKFGFSNFKFVSNETVSENGARTNDFLEAEKLNEIKNLLNENPDIEAVHLSIGGNDVLGNWNVNFTQQELDDLVDLVYGQVLEIIDSIKGMKEDIRIVFSGYTYPNFEEIIESAAPFQTSHPFYSTWSNMGFPSFLEINTILNHFSLLIEDYIQTDPQLAFVNATGILQYTFGQNTPLGVAPGGTYPAFSQPLPFGDPIYPSPQNSMRDYVLTKDCFHLSSRGYRDFIGYQFQKFYQKYFMNEFVLANENIEGSISSSLNTDASLKLGNEVGEEYGVVLDFQTSGVNFGNYNTAEIFLRIEQINGINPFDGEIELRVKSGFFGNSQSINGDDWNAPADATALACVFGKKDGNGDWIRIQVPQELMPYVGSQNNVQFFIKGLDANGLVTFSNASDPDFAAVLNFKMDQNITSINNFIKELDFTFYPNPTRQTITIENIENNIAEIKIYDMMGKLQYYEKTPTENTFNIGNLSSGIYNVELTLTHTKVSKKFLKE